MVSRVYVDMTLNILEFSLFSYPKTKEIRLELIELL